MAFVNLYRLISCIQRPTNERSIQPEPLEPLEGIFPGTLFYSSRILYLTGQKKRLIIVLKWQMTWALPWHTWPKQIEAHDWWAVHQGSLTLLPNPIHLRGSNAVLKFAGLSFFCRTDSKWWLICSLQFSRILLLIYHFWTLRRSSGLLWTEKWFEFFKLGLIDRSICMRLNFRNLSSRHMFVLKYLTLSKLWSHSKNEI